MGVIILPETTKYPLQKIGCMAGICWNSPVENPEKNIKRAKDCIKSGHGRVLEYVDVEMLISGTSARCIREYYTHIGGSPTRLQESTRYVDCSNFDYFIPFDLTGKQRDIYESCMKDIKKMYTELLDSGVSKEDAANILPLGMYTKIVDKRNLRNLINLMNQRLCSRAYSEIRELAKDIRAELYNYSDEWKWIAENLFVPKCEVAGFCTEKNSCGRKPKNDKTYSD